MPSYDAPDEQPSPYGSAASPLGLQRSSVHGASVSTHVVGHVGGRGDKNILQDLQKLALELMDLNQLLRIQC